MSGDIRGLSVRAVALRVLGDRVTAESTRVKAELASALTVGDRTTARLDNDVKVGSISYAEGKTSARVTDPQALAEWVLANYPDEVQPQVRPAFLAAILDASKRAGVPMAPDGTLDVPGVHVGVGAAYLSVRPEPSAVPQLVEAIRANQLLALDRPDDEQAQP